MTYTCLIDTPLGKMTAAAKEDVLTGLWFIGQKYYPVFDTLRLWLGYYFSGIDCSFTTLNLKLDPSGTQFQKDIWNILLSIPFGHVTTYGNIAKTFVLQRGLRTMSSQAVGGAVGHNPVVLESIPCLRAGKRIFLFNGQR